jgi:hypothetical protein
LLRPVAREITGIWFQEIEYISRTKKENEIPFSDLESA